MAMPSRSQKTIANLELSRMSINTIMSIIPGIAAIMEIINIWVMLTFLPLIGKTENNSWATRPKIKNSDRKPNNPTSPRRRR
jgi:hypothetical protein